jgi:hypothetical protein
VGSCDTNRSHFSFKKAINNTTIIRTDEEAHSGKYSLKLTSNASASITKPLVNFGNLDAPVYSFSGSGQYILNPLAGIKGFAPVAEKKYIFSCWVNDNNANSSATTARVIINGNSDYVTTFSKWPVVEGWKRIEFPFVMPATGEVAFNLTSSGGGTVYFDDVRIHPFDGQMKSYAYDPSSQRLWAEMDENNFATFYEYDDEGILIRVKKETERGIMTIKETRSSLRKRGL